MNAAADLLRRTRSLLVDGKLVGAVDVSGDLSEHDGQCAAAGAAALAAPPDR
ncbi:MAG: hypothetical protein E6J65_12855 [Deltaproteobacteria bacterium]|nr:MAG: hypothetical protein E6J65_12855 [Deltaproteobacteria bacterium]